MMDSFGIYVEKYSKQYDVTPEEAKTHAIVQEVKVYYDEVEEERRAKL